MTVDGVWNPTSGMLPFGGTGRGIEVGVIDSGWDRQVTDPRVAPGVGFVRSDDELRFGHSLDDQDRNGHGTVVTNLVLRVAPQITAVPLRVFGARIESSPSVLIAAIDWAAARGLRLVNLSLGTLRTDALVPLYAACERARKRGMVIVAAASNSKGGWSFPAVFDPVIGVQGAPLTHPDAIAYREAHVFECAARANAQRTRGLGGRPVRVTGTSFAAPIVTGHLARLLGDRGPMHIAEVRRLLGKLYGVSGPVERAVDGVVQFTCTEHRGAAAKRNR